MSRMLQLPLFFDHLRVHKFHYAINTGYKVLIFTNIANEFLIGK